VIFHKKSENLKIFGFFYFFCIFFSFYVCTFMFISINYLFCTNKVDGGYEFLRSLFGFIEAGEKVKVHPLQFESRAELLFCLLFDSPSGCRTVNSILLL